MPEGDTLHNFVQKLRPRFTGEPIESLRLRNHGEISAARGLPIGEIEAVGKHLLMLVERRFTRHVHLGLRGAYRIHDRDAAWQAAATASTVTLVVPQAVLTIFRSAVHELRPYRDMRLEQQLRRLGPDLLAPELDITAALARARAAGHRDLAVTDLLLDQTVVAGIGNVYRSEVLFLAGVHPWARVATLDDATLQGLLERAAALMRSNLGPWQRATVGPRRGVRRQPGTPRLWVYGREGLPCLRCRTLIRRSIEGRQARSTWWCPRCQPAPSTP
jgi:endonuclease-8